MTLCETQKARYPIFADCLFIDRYPLFIQRNYAIEGEGTWYVPTNKVYPSDRWET